MADVAHLFILGTPDNDDLVAVPTRPWTGQDDDNTMQGLDGDDLLAAGGGNDRIDGGPGDDGIDGGAGFDVAVYSQARQAYQVVRHDLAGGRQELLVSGPDGTDALASVERLEFRHPSGAPDPASPAEFGAFPAISYVASYPDLVIAFGANGDLAWRHYLRHGLSEGREVTFNGLEYIASYADLGTHLGPDARQGALHFIAFGLAEGRAVTFDGLQYVASYDDLAAAFAPLGGGAAIRDAGAAHFTVHGRSEGRTPDLFDEDQYLANYADLAAAGLETPDQLALHYILFGHREGRTDSPPIEPPVVEPEPTVGAGVQDLLGA